MTGGTPEALGFAFGAFGVAVLIALALNWWQNR